MNEDDLRRSFSFVKNAITINTTSTTFTTMTTKAIKISEENYALLVQKSAELARERGKPISLDAALGASVKGTKTMLDLVALKDKEFIKALEQAHRESRADKGRKLVW